MVFGLIITVLLLAAVLAWLAMKHDSILLLISVVILLVWALNQGDQIISAYIAAG